MPKWREWAIGRTKTSCPDRLSGLKFSFWHAAPFRSYVSGIDMFVSVRKGDTDARKSPENVASLGLVVIVGVGDNFPAEGLVGDRLTSQDRFV